MNISTKYNIGDRVVFQGKEYEILSMHIYESDKVHTERYYLGNSLWITIERVDKI